MKFLVLGLLTIMLSGCASHAVKSQDQAHLQKRAQIHTELAGMYFSREQMGIALSEIKLALQADENYAPAYDVRGLIHMSLHEDETAEKDFLHSLRLDKANSETQNNYGWFLCQRGHELKSIAHFMVAVKNPLYRTPERAYLNAGLCYQKAGKSQDAEVFLKHALRLQPGLIQALQAMAVLKFVDGDYSAAQQYFKQFSNNNLSAAQLWLGVRISRHAGDSNAQASYALKLRKRFPDAHETQLLKYGE
ncbi:MAG: type IV pilus biogenesis/stability protein PilW [Gallionella sp.]